MKLNLCLTQPKNKYKMDWMLKYDICNHKRPIRKYVIISLAIGFS